MFDINLDEFAALGTEPLDYNTFIKNERVIKNTLYFAEENGYRIDFIQKDLKINHIEYACDAGKIDLLGTKGTSIIVIEVKTDSAGFSTVGQIQAYIEAISEEKSGKDIRGIVIAKNSTIGYKYSLKASKYRELIDFISLSEILEVIYKIYLKIGEKMDKFDLLHETTSRSRK